VTPRQIDSVPSVVTKGDSRTIAISSPLIRPTRAAAAMPHTIAAPMTPSGTAARTVPEKVFISMAVSTAVKAMTEPTDKSMPPVMITRVEPSATIAM